MTTATDTRPTTTAEVVAYLKAHGDEIRHTSSFFPSFEAVEVLARAKELQVPGCGFFLFGLSDGEVLLLTPEVGMGAARYGWSDVHPFEVVRVVSDKCIEIRAMHAEGGLKKGAEFMPGGFVGHYPNQERDQEWTLTSNPEATVVRIRLNNRGRWMHKTERFSVGTAVKFRDYNF